MEKVNMLNNPAHLKNNKVPFLEKRINTEKLFGSDEQFNELYPLSIQSLARRHWTPLSVARKAASFLAAEAGASVLDIGSGVGKFCLAAAYYKPNAHYYGIEQRNNLIGHAKAARELLGFENVSFTHGNFTKLDLDSFDHFYFYNSFYENLVDSDKIDESIDYSGELYNYYTRFLCKQLEQKSKGTRIATFHSLEYEIPPSYHVVGSEFDDFLKFWIKVD